MPAVSQEALVVFLREKGRWIEASRASISEAALGPQLIYGRAVSLPSAGYLDVNYSAPDCVECARAILQAAGLDPSQLGYTLRDP